MTDNYLDEILSRLLQFSSNAREKGSEASEGSREQVLWGAAEWTGAVWYLEGETEGRPCHSLQLPERKL